MMHGKIFLVGLGPGAKDHMSFKAEKVIKESDIIIGYKTYLDLIKELIEGKETISKGMKQEMERAKLAVEKAKEGKDTAIISSGDPGIYAMASAVFEFLKEECIEVNVEIIPGITAATAAAALLGSPLGNDFAVISLSDLLTPWEVVKKRVEDAARGNFVLVLYNPKSSKREWQIEKAAEIIKKYRGEDVAVGIVKNAMRHGEERVITTLGKMLDHPIDMITTIIVGNSETFVYMDKMVTPRGYK
jgi:precorrin-3B C17-methyltransferase